MYIDTHAYAYDIYILWYSMGANGVSGDLSIMGYVIVAPIYITESQLVICLSYLLGLLLHHKENKRRIGVTGG